MGAFRLLLLMLVTMGGHAAAQTPGPSATPSTADIPRADVFGLLGWLNVDKDGVDGYNDWSRSLYGGVGAGWLLTDHLRVELDGGGSAETDLYRVRQIPRAGGVAYISSRSAISTRRVGVGALYQFYDNAWFHPHLGVGLDVTWERVRETLDPIYYFDELTRQTRALEAGGSPGPVTTRRQRPFVSAGFKAYVTERAFVRSDARLLLHGGLDEVLWRFGVGVDF